jgi:hypothetical protein
MYLEQTPGCAAPLGLEMSPCMTIYEHVAPLALEWVGPRRGAAAPLYRSVRRFNRLATQRQIKMSKNSHPLMGC